MRKDFPTQFRDCRKMKGFTVDVLAKKLGVTKSFISQVEHGLKRLSEELAQRAGEILEVENLKAWVYWATKAPIVESIQAKYPDQVREQVKYLLRIRKSRKSSIYKEIQKQAEQNTQ